MTIIQRSRPTKHFKQAYKLDANSNYENLLTTNRKYVGHIYYLKEKKIPPWGRARPQKYGDGGNVFLENLCTNLQKYIYVHIHSSNEKICERALKPLKHFINLRWHFKDDPILLLFNVANLGSTSPSLTDKQVKET